MIIRSPSLLLLLSLFIFTLSINASQKKKRDISDLKDDSLLSKVFASDIKEKEDTKERKDRSINLQDEQETNLKSGQQTAALYANYYNSLFATPETVPVAPAMERRAVDPVQEAMVAYATNPYFAGQAAKRNFIARPGQEQPQADANSQMKKSEIPSVPPPQDSFPLKLSLRSQNSKLQGAVPHFEEYGETVESVMKAQKRFKIPKPDYSSVIVKKDEIPHPDDVDKDNTNVNSKTKSSKRSKIISNKNNDSKKRQYIQYPQMQQQFALNNGYAANYMNGANYFNAQPMGGAMQFQQPSPMAVPSHVQNLDGAISRPIVTEKVCGDQFNLCSEYAKNDYCTNYRAQMEVQCRKSCGFCAPLASVSKAADDDDDGTSGSGESGSGENEPSKKRIITAKASRRHDILQERAHVPKSNLESSGEGSGSGSGSGDSSGSGSGASESAFEPSKRTVKEHSREETGSVGPTLNENAPEQEFHIPTKKDETSTPSNSDDESGSGSGSGSGDSEDKPAVVKIAPKPPKKPTKIKTNKRKSRKPNRQQKRTRIPRPEQPVFYPRIDLKEIASSLAHYEEAALELAGEYPNIQDTDTSEYTRSFIPHPESSDEVRANRNRQNIQIAKIITSERAKKDNIPKFLKITSDVKKPEKEESEADSLDSVQRRFSVPGVEPTLNDYYAETGKLNPFDRKTNKNSKKSNIENPFKMHNNYDPYEYLRNMPAGASMEPIIDPHKRSSIPSDHSYPVFLMKVSPSDEKKYVEEKADRRGKIRHFNAEGIEINEQKYQQMLRGGHPEMEEAIRRQQIADRKAAVAAVIQTRVAYNAAAAKRTQPRVPPPQPQVPFQQFNKPSFAQLQQNLQQQASLFPNNEPLSYEQQPGASSLRGKMLNAFFDTRMNSAPDEGSAMGSGDSSPGFRRNVY